MKRGTASTLIAITLAIIVLFALLRFIWPIIESFLYSETKSVSYQEFEELSIKIQDLIDKNADTAKTEMVIELEPGYQILGFQPNERERTCEPGNSIEKPEVCGNDACICLYKDEKFQKQIKCASYENVYFYNKFLASKSYSGSAMIPGTTKLSLNQQEFENTFKFQYPTCPGQSTYKSKDINYKSFSMLGYTPTTELVLYLKEEGNKKNIFILKKNDENKLIYKENTCPLYSVNGCNGGEFYDERRIMDIEGEMTDFICRFDENENKCLMQDIRPCTSQRIRSLCGCGDKGYDSGYCIKQRYYPNEIPETNEYCFANVQDGINECGDYEKGPYSDSMKEISCNMNPCKLDGDCYYDNGCVSCEGFDTGSLSNYGDGEITESINPCKVSILPCEYHETEEECKQWGGCAWINNACADFVNDILLPVGPIGS